MDPLTMIALGNAGMSGIQGINSGIKGAQANKQLNAAQTGADQTYQNLMTQGQNVLGGVIGNAGQYNTPTVGGDGSKGSGVGLDKQILNMGMGAAQGVAGNYNATAGALGNQGLAGQAAGMFGQDFRANALQGFDFAQPGQQASNMVGQALQMGDRARVAGREQLAGQTAGMQQGLSAALADRGLSANSGAAAAALQGNAMQGIQQMAGLERGIMDMAGQAGIQGAQLDTQNLMQMTGMASNYGMGMNQIQAGLDTAANQYRLGAGQGMAGLQGMQNDVTMQQGALRNAAYADPLNMMQGIYQQNYLNPNMQMNQLLGGIGGSMMAGGLGGMESGLDRRSNAVASAGSGKGSSMGNMMGFATDAGSGKGAKPIPIPNVQVG